MRCPLFPLVCLLAAAAVPGGAVAPAHGGAWLLPPGNGQAIVYSAFSDSTRAFNANGQLIPVPDYRKFELGTYIEYGLTERVTLVAAPAYDRISNPTPGQSYNGLGESEGAVRLGIFRNESSVISAQAGLRSPGASLADSAGPFLVRRAAALDLRGMAGRSCHILNMEGFAEAQGAYRFYANNQPGEWRIDLTAGVRPYPWLLVMLQSFTSITYGMGAYGHVSWTKLQPSMVYDLGPQWSLQLGGFITVAGINAGRELGPLGAIWYRF
ncbi:MAG TPA: hypothetical protein VFF88_05845 [Methylocella sp.]|nr:hypothetical protein [Methylocella sp.]